MGKMVPHNLAPRAAENIANEKDLHVNGTCDINTAGRFRLALYCDSSPKSPISAYIPHSPDQFNRSQIIIVARRIEPEVPDAAGVHDNIVKIPEINVRQIMRQNLLHLSVNLFALFLVN